MKNKEKVWVGGPCDYKAYEGRAEIISISLKKGSQEALFPKEEYEIKFLFFPDQKIKESYARVEGKEFLLLVDHTYFPDKAFIENHDIKVGKIFNCTLKVIIRGTCTPLIFEFPFMQDEGRHK